MNTLIGHKSNDIEQLCDHIGELEVLVKRQREFIDSSGETWQLMLTEERDRSRRTLQDSASLQDKVRKLEEIGTHREIERMEFEQRVATRAQGEDGMALAFRKENEVLNHRLNFLEEENAQRLQLLEAAKADLQSQLHAQVQTEEWRGRAGELEECLAHVQSELRQRQEEIEQTRVMLAEGLERAGRLEVELEEAKMREEALRHKLHESDGWVFQLAGERTASEKALTHIKRDCDVISRELQASLVCVARLRALVEDHKASASMLEAPGTVPERAAGALPQDAVETAKAQPKFDECDLRGVLHPVLQRNKQELLQRLKIDAPSSSTGAQAGAPSLLFADLNAGNGGLDPFAARTTPILGQTRNNELERKLSNAREHSDWLRRLNLVLLRSSKPWWLKFMPASIRRQQLLKALDRKDIFNATAYLKRYPDVAQGGVDPLTHYIHHGIDEERDR
jgi:hypothetical protein